VLAAQLVEELAVAGLGQTAEQVSEEMAMA